MQTIASTESFLKWAARVGAALVAAVGIAVLAGWVFDVRALKSIFSGLASMKPNTAFCFVCSGAGLMCVRESERPSKTFLAGRILAFVVMLFAVLTLLEYALGLNLHVDQLLFRFTAEDGPIEYPGRMTPATAIDFLLTSLALLSIKAHASFLTDRSRWLVVPVNMSASLALLCYVFGVTSLYKVALFGSMALHTAVLFWLLSVCIFIADCSGGVMKVVVSDTAGGVAARRLIPRITASVVVLSLARLAGERAGLYDDLFGRALLAVAIVAVVTFLVMQVTKSLYDADIKRKQAEAEISAMNATLEQRVKERTAELEQTLAEMRQLSGLLPICSYCKKVRDDKDYWHTVENFVMERTDARFSHGICPDCLPHVRAQMGLKPRLGSGANEESPPACPAGAA